MWFQLYLQPMPQPEDRHPQPLSGAGREPRMLGNCELGRGLRRREKNANEAAGRSSRGSRVAHQPEDRCGSAIERATLLMIRVNKCPSEVPSPR